MGKLTRVMRSGNQTSGGLGRVIVVAGAIAAGTAAGGCRSGTRHDVVVVRHAPSDSTASMAATEPAGPVGPITVRLDDATTVRSASAGAGLDEFINRRCVVHLRRDAAGMAGSAPMPISEERFARAASVPGVLRRATPAGVLLEAEQSMRWVPSDVILVIDFPTAATTRRAGRP